MAEDDADTVTRAPGPSIRLSRGGARYFVRQVVVLIVTLWVALTVNFILPRLMPGDPGSVIVAKLQQGGGQVSDSTLQAVQSMLGIPNKSLIAQYGDYLKNLFSGNFGASYAYYPTDVGSLITQSLPWTLALVGLSTVLSFTLGTALGVWVAWRRGAKLDSLATTAATFGSGLPYFWLAMLLLFLFGYRFQLFPLSGGYDPAIAPGFSFSFVSSALTHSALPALSIIISGLGIWTLGMRNNAITVLNDDYVLLARAMGLSHRRIAFTYVARNALLPSVTSFGVVLGTVLGGSILTEIVFSYPGVGSLLKSAVDNQDFPLMQALFLFTSVAVIMANFLAEIAYGILDPRVRRQSDTT